jgi:hypothetical protein
MKRIHLISNSLYFILHLHCQKETPASVNQLAVIANNPALLSARIFTATSRNISEDASTKASGSA